MQDLYVHTPFAGDGAGGLPGLAFPQSTDELGRVTHLAWFDKPDGGKLWAWGELGKSKLMEPKDRFVIEPGDIDARLELGAG